MQPHPSGALLLLLHRRPWCFLCCRGSHAERTRLLSVRTPVRFELETLVWSRLAPDRDRACGKQSTPTTPVPTTAVPTTPAATVPRLFSVAKQPQGPVQGSDCGASREEFVFDIEEEQTGPRFGTKTPLSAQPTQTTRNKHVDNC